jgi:Zn-dependent metalloprotease
VPTAVALTLGFLAGLPAASATPHTQAPAKAGSRPDPGFTPAERQAAVAQAAADSAQTGRELKLGNKEALVVKDVARDADGTEHVRYERTYAGLPVIGGDLVVHQSSGRSVRRTGARRGPRRSPAGLRTFARSGRARCRRLRGRRP